MVPPKDAAERVDVAEVEEDKDDVLLAELPLSLISKFEPVRAKPEPKITMA